MRNTPRLLSAEWAPAPVVTIDYAPDHLQAETVLHIQGVPEPGALELGEDLQASLREIRAAIGIDSIGIIVHAGMASCARMLPADELLRLAQLEAIHEQPVLVVEGPRATVSLEEFMQYHLRPLDYGLPAFDLASFGLHEPNRYRRAKHHNKSQKGTRHRRRMQRLSRKRNRK